MRTLLLFSLLLIVGCGEKKGQEKPYVDIYFSNDSMILAKHNCEAYILANGNTVFWKPSEDTARLKLKPSCNGQPRKDTLFAEYKLVYLDGSKPLKVIGYVVRTENPFLKPRLQHYIYEDYLNQQFKSVKNDKDFVAQINIIP